MNILKLKNYHSVAKKILILLLISFCFNPAKAIVVFFNYSVFKNDHKNAIIELYFKIPVSSISFQKNTNNKYYASLNYDLKFSIGDSTYFYKTYNLISPDISDTLNLNYALTDLKRIELPYNIYNLEVQFTDNFDLNNLSEFNTLLNAKVFNNTVSFSDIQFLDTFYQTKQQNKFSRNNYDLIPNVFNAYTAKQKKLYFYTEIYNLKDFAPNSQIYIRYFLKKDSLLLEGLEKIVKQNSAEINIVIGQSDINILPEGEYELAIEVYTTDNKILKTHSAWFSKRNTHEYFLTLGNKSGKTEFIQLINSYSIDLLRKYIDYVGVIATASEENKINLLANENDKVELESFFLNFWMKRDSLNPATEWLIYLKKIEDCNRQFSNSFREGYLSDRGRVYLQYGPPNSLSESSGTMLAYPYQIWHYYSLPNNQQNKRFVFFNRSGALNEYELLHSNANGEIQNEKWREIISKFNNINPNDSRFFGDFLDKDFTE